MTVRSTNPCVHQSEVLRPPFISIRVLLAAERGERATHEGWRPLLLLSFLVVLLPSLGGDHCFDVVALIDEKIYQLSWSPLLGVVLF